MSSPPGDDPLLLPDLASRALRGSVVAGDGAERDRAVVRLGAPGVIGAVVVDTAFLAGNRPRACSVEACSVPGYPASLERAPWTEIVPRTPLTDGARHVLPVSSPRRFTHVRLRARPDGGVARLGVHGTVVPDPAFLEGLTVDLATLENGGDVATCSDQLYSSPRNLISPGLPGMAGEGWQTPRRREPGSEWVIIRLAGQALISVAEIDTSGYTGNGPDAASLTGRDETGSGWNVLLESASLRPDTPHRFRLPDPVPVTHVRLNVFPGGGLARLRLLGSLTGAGLDAARRRWDETV